MPGKEPDCTRGCYNRASSQLSRKCGPHQSLRSPRLEWRARRLAGTQRTRGISDMAEPESGRPRVWRPCAWRGPQWPYCKQGRVVRARRLGGRSNTSKPRSITSKTPSTEATDAGIETLNTTSTRVVICARVEEGNQLGGWTVSGAPHLDECDNLFKWCANLQQSLICHPAQVLARLAHAAPAEKEQYGKCGAYEGCQRCCIYVLAQQALGSLCVVVERAVANVKRGNVAQSAIWPR
eukprot:scaffold22164_cov68-Phaeocystis_antarctica.AAC.6